MTIRSFLAFELPPDIKRMVKDISEDVRRTGLGLEMETERISTFRDSLQERLLDFGVKEEKRAFTPHLTLGRFRKPERNDPLLGDIISQYADIKGPVSRL